MSQSKTKRAKSIECVVVSDKVSKTRVGQVTTLRPDPRCGKYQKKSSRVVFHDENSQTKVGDVVLVSPSKPMSATKRFILVSVKRSANKLANE